MARAYFEDYEVGERRTTPGRTITEADITNFAGLSGDWHPLHTDAEFADATPYGERVAHSMLVLSIGSALASRLGQYEALPKSFIAFYGMEDVKFLAPVLIGDTIHLETEIAALDPKDDARGIVETQSKIINQHGDVVCSYISKILCGRQPS